MQDIEEAYKMHSRTVYKYLFCLTKNEEISEDLTQETFAIAVKEINKFKGNCKLSVWLCQIAKHLWYKQLKKNKKVNIGELDENIPDINTIDDLAFKDEEKIWILKQMQKLDQKEREVLYLRSFGNLNFNQIAEVLGKTPNWTRVVFYRAKQKLKEVKENDTQ